MSAKTLMIAGTMSSVGKSLITAGLCRLFARNGVSVAPFKAQNMSNNAAVCADGGEIGRAQAIQAQAARILPTVDMNPILMKPEADYKSQIIVQGAPIGTFSGRDYYHMRESLWGNVTESLDRLREAHELVLIEGAGSIAELNLAGNDIVNLRVARYANAPVLLVGDIDRGGIFAQLLGSRSLLDPGDQARIRGFIVNKFRGDSALFADGVRILETRPQGAPVVGVVPWLKRHRIPDEDAAAFSDGVSPDPNAAKIAVVQLPHISNFDDFDPLKYEKFVDLRYAKKPADLTQSRAIILPGTKNTIGDLRWLRKSGLFDEIRKRYENGTPVVGICGGYQVMGTRINEGAESESGLSILPIETQFSETKTTCQVTRRVVADRGLFAALNGEIVSGYEIHHGRTASTAPLFSAVDDASETDGSLAPDGKSFGTYLHGLFFNDSFRRSWLKSLGIAPDPENDAAKISDAFNALADHLEKNLNISQLKRILNESEAG